MFFFLICFQEYASTVRQIAQSSSMNMKDRLTIELHRKPGASSFYVCIVGSVSSCRYNFDDPDKILQTVQSMRRLCNSKGIQSFHANICRLPKYNY